jgi:GNAT superfamily N-acetyltransferase
MPIEVRAARAEDANSLADFLRELNHFRRLEGRTTESVRAQVRDGLRLCLADSSHSVHLAQDTNGRILGYASVHWLPYLFLPGPEGYVSELFVASDARGQGIGTRLLEAVKSEAATRNCSRLSLLNMRDRESYQRAFYAKDGWEERTVAANFIFEMNETWQVA